jgi:hypothetical protein
MFGNTFSSATFGGVIGTVGLLTRSRSLVSEVFIYDTSTGTPAFLSILIDVIDIDDALLPAPYFPNAILRFAFEQVYLPTLQHQSLALPLLFTQEILTVSSSHTAEHEWKFINESLTQGCRFVSERLTITAQERPV